MQIYEITRPALTEGVIGDTFKDALAGTVGMDPASRASRAAQKLGAQGYGPGGKMTPSAKWEDKLGTVMQDPAVKSYINTLTAGWNNYWKSEGMSAPVQKQTIATAQPTASKTAPAQTSTDWRQDALKATGANIPKEPTGVSTPTTEPAKPGPRPKYGRAGVSTEPEPTVTMGGRRLDPKNPNDAKVLDAMRRQGKLHEAPEEYTTPGGIVVPASTKTDKPTAEPVVQTDDSNAALVQQKFVDWTDKALASRSPTGHAISMDDVRKLPGLAEKLDAALNNVIKTMGTAQANYNIGEYLKLAVAGVQAKSQEYKNRAPQEITAAVGAATQAVPAMRAKLAQAGVNSSALKTVGDTAQNKRSRSTGNPEADALLKMSGFEFR